MNKQKHEKKKQIKILTGIKENRARKMKGAYFIALSILFTFGDVRVAEGENEGSRNSIEGSSNVHGLVPVRVCLHEGRPSQLNTAKVSLRNLQPRFRTFENGTVLR